MESVNAGDGHSAEATERVRPCYKNQRFSYPGTNDLASPGQLLRWMLTRKPARWPRLSNPPADAVHTRVNDRKLRVTYINHATVLIQSDGLNILTDPVFSKRASPTHFAGPRRFRPAGLTINELPVIDSIVLSHTHYDHLDLSSLQQLYRRDQPQLITPLHVGGIVNQPLGTTATELNWWDHTALSDTTTATLVPARHWTSRTLGDTNKCLWGGFVLNFPGGAVYFAGDTGYGDGQHFCQIASQFPHIRCALLPIGAYEPRWFMRPQHMNPEEAVRAFLDLNAACALGIHHGTFKLTDEGHDQPVQDLRSALNTQDIPEERFITLDNGRAWDVPEFFPAIP